MKQFATLSTDASRDALPKVTKSHVENVVNVLQRMRATPVPCTVCSTGTACTISRSARSAKRTEFLCARCRSGRPTPPRSVQRKSSAPSAAPTFNGDSWRKLAAAERGELVGTPAASPKPAAVVPTWGDSSGYRRPRQHKTRWSEAP